jgi:hypothetical protein
MRPFLSVFGLSAALAVAGCATPEQRADEMASYITENYAATCAKLGYAAGSDNHRNCMLSMYNADQLRNSVPWYRPGRRW